MSSFFTDDEIVARGGQNFPKGGQAPLAPSLRETDIADRRDSAIQTRRRWLATGQGHQSSATSFIWTDAFGRLDPTTYVPTHTDDERTVYWTD